MLNKEIRELMSKAAMQGDYFTASVLASLGGGARIGNPDHLERLAKATSALSLEFNAEFRGPNESDDDDDYLRRLGIEPS